MAELDRYAEDNHLDVEALLQVDYRLHSIQVRDLAVLNLRSPTVVTSWGWRQRNLALAWDVCQPVGHAARFL